MVRSARLNQKLNARRTVANIGCQPVVLDIHDIPTDGCHRFKQTSQPAGLVFHRCENVEIAPLTNHPALDDVSQQLQIHIPAAEQTNRTSLPQPFVLKERRKTRSAAWLHEDFHPRKQQQNCLRDGVV